MPEFESLSYQLDKTPFNLPELKIRILKIIDQSECMNKRYLRRHIYKDFLWYPNVLPSDAYIPYKYLLPTLNGKVFGT